VTTLIAALAGPASKAGVVAVTLVAATALITPRERLRAMIALAALLLAPALLIADLADSPQLRFARQAPIKAVAAAAVGVLIVGGLAWLLRRNSKTLPILIAATLPFRIPIEIGGETANLLLPLYLVIAAGAVAWVLPLIIRRDDDARREPRPLDWALAAWLALFGLCAIWSLDPGKALQQAVFFYVPFSVLYLLLIRINWTAELIRGCGLVLVGVALLFSAVGFYEYWTETLLLNPKLLVSNEFHTYFRVNSVFFDPNIYGRFLMLVMIGLAATLLSAVRGRNIALCCGALAILLAALLTTLSQSSLIGLLAGLATLAALHWRARYALATVGALFAAGILAVAFAPSLTGVNFSSLRVLNSESSGRAGLVSGGLDLFGSRPIAGWGSGGFAKAYQHERSAGAPTALTASHTAPVTIAAEQGLIGLIIYLALIIIALIQLFRGARGSTARAAVAAGLVALLVHSMLYAAFFEDPAAWVLLALGVALPMPPTREERRAAREASRAAAAKAGSTGAPAV